VKKGAPVYVEGRLQTREWEGQDGAKRQRTEIVADNIIVLGRRGETAPKEEEGPIEEIAQSKEKKTEKKKEDTQEPAEAEEIDIDEIPF